MSLDVGEARDVALRALDSWEFDVENLSLLKLSENQTFRIDTRSGTRFVVRVHRPGYSSVAELESEHIWIRALDLEGFGVPQPVPASNGSGYVEVSSVDGPRQVGVITWIDGTSMADVLDATEELATATSMFEQLGAQMARLHNQTEAWVTPPVFTRRRWDLDGLLGDAAHWGRFWAVPQLSASEAEVLDEARAELRQRIGSFDASPSSFGLIHADLHAENVLVSPSGLVMIDFDDSGFGWHMYDLAVAMSYQIGTTEFDAVFAAAIKGYRSVRDLGHDQLATVRDFLVMRTLVTVGWINDRPELEGYEHIGDVIDRAVKRCEQYLAGGQINR
ncbi:MAG: phosphotransferase [Actinomycetota bacterium]|nr:phosphotransferase [Actinomycetota bacterium]